VTFQAVSYWRFWILYICEAAAILLIVVSLTLPISFMSRRRRPFSDEPSNHNHLCKTKQQLANVFALAVWHYSNAALALSEDTEPSDAEAIRHATVEARLKVERARLDYDGHITEHGC